MGAKAANLLVEAMKKPDDYVREEVIIRSKLIVRI
jgi:DNA-binding LacI/PurR family transcriptional regulator